MVPAVLINAREKAKAKLDEMLRLGKEQFHGSAARVIHEGVMDRIQEATEYLEALREAILIFRRNELSMEVIPQLTVQSLVLLLSWTISPTVNGLEAVFAKDLTKPKDGLEWAGLGFTQVFLIFSILWSFLTTAKSYVKIKAEHNIDFLPLSAKMLLGFRALVAYTSRIGCFVMFFTPFMGLMGCLAHWTAEQVPLNPKVFAELQDQGDFHYWDGQAAKVVPGTLFRSNYSDTSHPAPPKYTVYSVVTLQAAYCIFWGLLLLQSVLTILLKRTLSEEFRAASWGSKLQHVVEAVNLPETFSAWDEGGGSPAEHRRRWRAVRREMAATIGLHCFFNLLMVIPIMVTGRAGPDLSVVPSVCLSVCLSRRLIVVYLQIY
jgi:hypothetical protein